MRQSVQSFIPTLMALTILMALVAVVKSDPNTSVVSHLCNDNSYASSDPFGNSVAYVLAALMNETPSQQGFNYYTVSPYATATAYGHATCSTNLFNNECANCLAAARNAVSSLCSGQIGGQVALGDCSMRYENYSFT